MILSKFNIWKKWILGKMTNLTPKIIIYFLALLFHSLFWNKLAKNILIYVLNNSVEPLMSKNIFFPEEMHKNLLITFKFSQH